MSEHPMMPDLGDYDPSFRGFMRSLGRAILDDVVDLGVSIRSEFARTRASLLGEIVVEAEIAHDKAMTVRDKAIDEFLDQDQLDVPSTVPTDWVKKYY